MTGKDSFVHLHVHTEFSMLDGAAKIDDALEYVKRMGQPALAMTDHGNVFGAYDFVQAAEKAGINPIVGMEAYLAPGHRSIRKNLPIQEVGPQDRYTHMTLLSENNQGMQNLFRLSSLASMEGFYHKPRVDRELLSQYSTGLIATSGCMGGEVKQLLLAGQYDAALKTASEFQDIFGKENYYIEIMDHGIEEERQIFDDLVKIARTIDAPLVATNDSHFTHPEQKTSHDALLCIQTGAKVHDEKRFRFHGDGYHIKSSEEMRELWRDYPEACDNTLLIAERCDVSFEKRHDAIPKFPVPDGYTELSYLKEDTWRGIKRRYGTVTPEIEERANYELDVIEKMGYPGYFLVVSDFIRWGKNRGIRFGPGRGSAGGSIVAYALDITELDPLHHKLMFERFLNVDRISMPDVDIDIQDDRREEVIQYVVQKYGAEAVSQIITYGTIKGKSALKDAARVLDKPIALANSLSKAYPPAHFGKETPLKALFDKDHPNHKETGELKGIYDANPDAREVIDLGLNLEGLKRQWGVHAAGVIISELPLIDVLPLIKRERDGTIVSQFDMGAVENLGLLKMDFLGLKNLTIIEEALQAIESRTGNKIILEDLPLDDAPTFKLMAKGNTLGVFQLDSNDIRKLLRRMKPTTFEDISATLALYRPGPMGANAHNDYADRKNGRKPVEYIHPDLTDDLKPILEETHGVIVYQEQVMLIAQKLAGYTLPQADLLRKAMGKKIKAEMDKQRPAFLSGMLERGYSQEVFETVWTTLEPFSDYAFNRAHTAGYGLISYWTAYLKANYPAEYMSALLSAFVDKEDRTALYLGECRRMGLEVLPPNINESEYSYTVNQNNQIVYGLGAIKGIGEGPVENIRNARQKGGEFKSLTDFFYRTDLTKRQVEPLIFSGALDVLNHTRQGMIESYLPILTTAKIKAQEDAVGIKDVFTLLNRGKTIEPDISDPEIPFTEWDDKTRLENERGVLGIYLSGHPLNGYVKAIEQQSTYEWLDIPQLPHDETVIIGGLLTNVTHRISKRGNPWCAMNLMSLDGTIEMRCFDRNLLEKKRELFKDGEIVMVKTSVMNADGDAVSLKVDNIKRMTVRDEDLEVAEPIRLKVHQSSLTPTFAEDFKNLLKRYRGYFPLELWVEESGNVIEMPFKVSNDDALKRRILKLLGNDAILKGFGE